MNQERLPNWEKWRQIPEVEVWEAVALSLNIEPGEVRHSRDGWMSDARLFDEDQAFVDRVDVATRNLGHGLRAATIQPRGSATDSSVSLPGFAAWAVSITWSIPAELAELGAKADTAVVVRTESRAHISDKLAKMNQAATKFWSNSDRHDRGTHPDNATVAAWLVRQGFSSTLADKAATIIRPEWAPTGRKPEE